MKTGKLIQVTPLLGLQPVETEAGWQVEWGIPYGSVEGTASRNRWTRFWGKHRLVVVKRSVKCCASLRDANKVIREFAVAEEKYALAKASRKKDA